MPNALASHIIPACAGKPVCVGKLAYPFFTTTVFFFALTLFSCSCAATLCDCSCNTQYPNANNKNSATVDVGISNSTKSWTKYAVNNPSTIAQISVSRSEFRFFKIAIMSLLAIYPNKERYDTSPNNPCATSKSKILLCGRSKIDISYVCTSGLKCLLNAYMKFSEPHPSNGRSLNASHAMPHTINLGLGIFHTEYTREAKNGETRFQKPRNATNETTSTIPIPAIIAIIFLYFCHALKAMPTNATIIPATTPTYAPRVPDKNTHIIENNAKTNHTRRT